MRRKLAGGSFALLLLVGVTIYALGGLGGLGGGGSMGGGGGSFGPTGNPPTVTGVTPTIGSVEGHTWVLVTGTEFMSPNRATQVAFNGTNSPLYQVLSDTQLICYTPAHAAGSVQVTVTNAGGTSTNNIQYTYTSDNGAGAGSVDFAATPTILTTTSAVERLAKGDFYNQDHKMDLATVDSYNNTIHLFQNVSSSGTITFATAVSLTPVNHPRAVACADMNGDGWDDLVTANVPGDEGEISVYINNTNGTFSAPVTHIFAFPNPRTPEKVALADFDNDGWCDIAVATFGNQKIIVLQNSTSTVGGAFVFGSAVEFDGTFFQTGIISGDWDNDALNDLALTELYTANGGGNFMYTHENLSSGTGNFNFAPREEWNVSVGPSDLVCLDGDADGLLDIATADSFNNSMSVFENTSTTNNINFATRVGLTIGFGPFFLNAADFSGDGWPDLVCTDDRTTDLIQDQGLSFFKNRATGAISTSYTYRLEWPLTINVTGNLVPEDYDLDGKTDLAMIVDGSQVYVLHNESQPIGVNLDPGNGLAVSEQGPTNDTYTLVLTSQPGDDVVITVDPDSETNLGAGTGISIQLTFTKTNYATPQTVTVTAVDDSQVEGLHTGTITHTVVSDDPDYDGFAINNVIVQITDNDAVILTQSGGNTQVTENGAGDSYTIVLGTQPAPGNIVVVNVGFDNTQLELESQSTSPIVVTFNNSNWNTPVTIDVDAFDDSIPEGPHGSVITHTIDASTTETQFLGIPIESINVAITDDDYGVVITQTSGTTAVTEGGNTDSYTVHLATQPSATVDITIATDSQVDTDETMLTFTTTNWSTPQPVLVTAVDDSVIEGSHISILTHTASSTDGNYNGIAIDDISVTVTDNDTFVLNDPYNQQDPVNNPLSSGGYLHMLLDPTDNFMGGGGPSFTVNDLAPALSGGSLYQDTLGHASLHNGDFMSSQIIHNVRARGLDFTLAISYSAKHSQIATPLGRGWDHNYNARLEKSGNDWLLHTGFQQTIKFSLTRGSYYEGPAGNYSVLRDNGSTLTIRNRHGMQTTFTVIGGDHARLSEIKDPNNNTLTFSYTGDLLTTVTDVYSRAYTFNYNTYSRLESVTDFAGREIAFNYDTEGQTLLNYQLPEVSGTSTGNDFSGSNRKTVAYTYLTHTDPALDKKLTNCKLPNEVADSGPAYLSVGYIGTGTFKGRVQTLTTSGTNYSGEAIPTAEVNYSYQLSPNKTTVDDRNGNDTEYIFNATGQCTEVTEFATDAGDATTILTYNNEGEVVQISQPLTNLITLIYDATPQMRYNEGNVVQVTLTPDSTRAPITDQTTIVSKYVWEPIYNHLYKSVDPRGTDTGFTPPNGGTTSEARYTTTHICDYNESADPGSTFVTNNEFLGQYTGSQLNSFISNEGVTISLGEINGDSVTQYNGNTIATVLPKVNLIAGPQSTAEGNTDQYSAISMTYTANGQVTSVTDQEENISLFYYFSSIHTGSLSLTGGGYLGRTIQDTTLSGTGLSDRSATFFGDIGRDTNQNPTETVITSDLVLNNVGVVTRSINPRGVATDYEVNQLDQTVKITRAASIGFTSGRGGGFDNQDETLTGQDFSYATLIFYDYNNQVIATFVENSDSDTSDVHVGAGGGYPGAISLPNGNGWIESYTYHNILGNVVLTRTELNTTDVGSTSFDYDANENRTFVTYPELNGDTMTYTARDLLKTYTRGATSMTLAATTTNFFDKNRNVIKVEDADQTDPDTTPGNELTLFDFDGFDRLKRSINPVGTVNESTYDPASNVITQETLGQIDGESPDNNDQTGNESLSVTDSHFDELSRQFRTVEHLFISSNLTFERTPNPDGSTVTTQYDLDRLGRNTFLIEEDGDNDVQQFDGASRMIHRIDVSCSCANTVDNFYDDHGNLIKRVETDEAEENLAYTEPAAQTFTFYNDFDSLDRMIYSATPAGASGDFHGSYLTYDSRNNVRASADSNGPGSVSLPLSTGAPSGTTNNPGNVTKFFYDAASRQTSTVRIMTASGLGDGTFNPTPDTTQGGGNGLITTSVEYDRNSRIDQQTDDNGSATLYFFDDLDRNYQITYADTTTKVFQFDKDGNPEVVTDQNGSVHTNSFDAANRRIAVDVDITNAPANVLPLSLKQRWQFDGLDRITLAVDSNDDELNAQSAVDDDMINGYRYNSRSQLLEEEQTISSDFTSTVFTRVISNDYVDETDRTKLYYAKLKGVTDPQPSVGFTWDIRDRVDTITYNPASGSPFQVAQYDFMGYRLLQKTLGNGTVERHHNGLGSTAAYYDGNRNMIQKETLRQNTGTLINTVNLRDRMNFRVSWTRNDDIFSYTENWGLDSAYRFINRDVVSAFNVAYVTDGAQNWLQRITTPGAARTYVHNPMNEYTDNYLATPGENPMAWDDNGNLTSETINSAGDTYEYFHDPHNRIREVRYNPGGSLLAGEDEKEPGPGTPTQDGEKTPPSDYGKNLLGGPILFAQYNYFSDNRRDEVKVTNSGAADRHEHSYWDNWEILQVFSVSGTNQTIQKTFVNGRTLDEHVLYIDNTNNQHYLHPDEHGNVVALSDATGNTVEELYDLSPFGGTAFIDPVTGNSLGNSSPAGNPYLFHSRERDPETSNYYYRNRYYFSNPAQFYSRDAGDIWGDPLSLGDATNAFAGNPVNFVDPFAFESGYVDENDSWGNFGRDAGDYDCMGRYVPRRGKIQTTATIQPNSAELNEALISMVQELKDPYVIAENQALMDWARFIDFKTRPTSGLPKGTVKGGPCKMSDPCLIIAAKIFARKAAIAYRVADSVWRQYSGNFDPNEVAGHQEQIEGLRRGVENCVDKWKKKGCDKDWPIPVWVDPRTVTSKVKARVQRRTDPMDFVKGVGVGLTGYVAYKAIRAAAVSLVATPAVGIATLAAP